MGDLNIDMSEISKSQDRLKILSFCRAFGMDQFIATPTRFGQNKNSILDVLLARAIHITSYGTVNLDLSDHLLIYFVKKKVKNTYEK